MEELEKFGTTWLGRLLDKRAKAKRIKKENDKIIDESCTCSVNHQVIGCSAYSHKKCIWHPDNDPYGLKDRIWNKGKFIKKSK